MTLAPTDRLSTPFFSTSTLSPFFPLSLSLSSSPTGHSPTRGCSLLPAYSRCCLLPSRDTRDAGILANIERADWPSLRTSRKRYQTVRLVRSTVGLKGSLSPVRAKGLSAMKLWRRNVVVRNPSRERNSTPTRIAGAICSNSGRNSVI